MSVQEQGVPRSLQVTFFLGDLFSWQKRRAKPPQTEQFPIPPLQHFMRLSWSDPDRFSRHSIFAPIIAIAKMEDLYRESFCHLDFLWRGR
jgi:hypothetical protein